MDNINEPKRKFDLLVNSVIDSPEKLGVQYGRILRDEYGITYQSTEKDSFYARMLKKIDKVYGKAYDAKTTEEEMKIIETISATSQYLAEHVHKNLGDFIKIQINMPTPFNDLLHRNPIILRAEENQIENMQSDHDPNAAHVLNSFASRGNIFLGVDFFNNKHNNFANTISTMTSKKDCVEYVLLHEFSHTVDFETRSKYINTHKDETNHVLKNLSSSTNMYNLEKINQSIEKDFPNGEYTPIKPAFSSQLHTLRGEMYADISGILLQRNYKIHLDDYTPEHTEKMVDVISLSRRNTLVEIDAPKGTILTHMTSPSLDSLKSELNTLPNRTLTDEEIHNITDKHMRIGMAKTILTMIHADNHLIPQFKSLFSLQKNPQYSDSPHIEEPYMKIDTGINHFQKTVQHLKSIVGKEWDDSLTEKVNNIEKLSTIRNKSDSIYYAGLHPKKHEQNYSDAMKRYTEWSDLLSDNPVVAIEVSPKIDNIDSTTLNDLPKITDGWQSRKQSLENKHNQEANPVTAKKMRLR